MAEQIGLVLSTFENHTAEVITDRKEACSGCGDAHKCRTCLTSSKFTAKVQNPIGAGQGDVVTIYLKDSALMTGALFLYIVPVLWLLVGAVIGTSLGPGWGIGETGGAIVLGMLALAMGLAITTLLSKSTRLTSQITPRIIRVIEPARNKKS